MEELLKANIRKNGKQMQMIVAVEELSELQKELTKNMRGKDNLDALAEEIVDVEIMIAQLKLMFPEIHGKLNKWRDFKYSLIEARCVDDVASYAKAKEAE